MNISKLTRVLLSAAAAAVLAVLCNATIDWAAPANTSDSAAKDKTPALVDLNTATRAELENVPGIGSAYAKKIISHRPYASVNDLSKSGIPAARLEKIVPLVTVKAKKPAPGTASDVAAAPAEASDSTDATDTDKAPVTKTRGRTRGAQTTDTAPATPPEKGMVWVNTESKVYHVEGDRWYGKTKHGKWMTEDDAVKAGYRKAK